VQLRPGEDPNGTVLNLPDDWGPTRPATPTPTTPSSLNRVIVEFISWRESSYSWRESSSLFMVLGMPQEERAQIDAVQRRLAQKYAELPHDHVAAVVQHLYAGFNQSTLRDFIPLLVERRAGEELARSTAGRQAAAGPGHAVVGSEIVDVCHMSSRNGARRQGPAQWRLVLGLSLSKIPTALFSSDRARSTARH
jgi:hypothetical protein